MNRGLCNHSFFSFSVGKRKTRLILDMPLELELKKPISIIQVVLDASNMPYHRVDRVRGHQEEKMWKGNDVTIMAIEPHTSLHCFMSLGFSISFFHVLNTLSHFSPQYMPYSSPPQNNKTKQNKTTDFSSLLQKCSPFSGVFQLRLQCQFGHQRNMSPCIVFSFLYARKFYSLSWKINS